MRSETQLNAPCPKLDFNKNLKESIDFCKLPTSNFMKIGPAIPEILHLHVGQTDGQVGKET